ncbi:MAG: hypothetical protein H0X27_12970 [Caulobacteraceae bacterium]|nr:hypothetical protein [Caulobacteraceae bacterium]
MPDLDGGHYFLTVLAPVRMDTMIDPVTGRSRSHRQVLAQDLALLRTGRQTAASPPDDPPSPFAANTLNHLARFVVIDGPAFNGRVSGDALLDKIRGVDPLAPQPVDALATPYLLFAAEVDARGDGPTALRTYTDALWATMNQELRTVFGHCKGFDGVDGAARFNAFVEARRVETTLPFNDYRADDPAFAGDASPPGAIGTAVAVVWRLVTGQAAKPSPATPGSDLPSVLKALFLQQHFTRFAIEAQGLDDAALHARFGAFLGAVRPGEPTPTQPPGEIFAPPAEWAP